VLQSQNNLNVLCQLGEWQANKFGHKKFTWLGEHIGSHDYAIFIAETSPGGVPSFESFPILSTMSRHDLRRLPASNYLFLYISIAQCHLDWFFSLAQTEPKGNSSVSKKSTYNRACNGYKFSYTNKFRAESSWKLRPTRGKWKTVSYFCLLPNVWKFSLQIDHMISREVWPCACMGKNVYLLEPSYLR